MIFRDRTAAGQALAGLLKRYANRPDTVVLGLPRGGVAVAHEIGKALNLPLDIFIVRKLGVPGHEELAMGAVATGGVRYINRDLVDALRIDAQTIDEVSAREETEVARRENAYRGRREPLDVRGKTVILVDDGLATGSTMRVAIAALRQLGPARVVVAVPAGARDACAQIHREADQTICALSPESFFSVSEWYEEFPQTTDQEVRELLASSSRTAEARPCSIPIDGGALQGDLTASAGAKGFVIFAHGSGSSRHSPRNKYIARALNRDGFATLLVDLLTVEEETADIRTSEFRFDIDLQARRLVLATDWLAAQRTFSGIPVGLFGSSTGGAAALIAASLRPRIVRAVVCRGGRPDLAGKALRKVLAPSLFIVGELDQEVLELNREASKATPGRTDFQIVPGATHLFEEPGALAQVAALARNWFTRRLIYTKAA
jgi:putative phosphoribosyl transferase